MVNMIIWYQIWHGDALQLFKIYSATSISSTSSNDLYSLFLSKKNRLLHRFHSPANTQDAPPDYECLKMEGRQDMSTLVVPN